MQAMPRNEFTSIQARGMNFDQQLTRTSNRLIPFAQFNNGLMALGPNGIRQH
jgi:hypothetical protein